MALPTDNVSDISDAEIVSETPAPAAPPAPASVAAPAAPEAPAAPPAPAVPSGSEIAPVTANAKLAQVAAEEGFEGMDFDGYGTFPMVSLKQGTFSCNEGWSLPDTFYGILQSTRKKSIYKNGLPDSDPNTDFFYTYDQITSVSGDMVEDLVAAWRAKGWTPVIKPYIDATITLVGGEHDGQVIILSVPKSSISRLSVHWANMKASGRPYSEIVTEVKKGPLTKSKGFEFTPILFSIYQQ